VLDILKKVLTLKDYTYLELTGATPVDARQALVDEFSEDDSIPVFLLSTKAGGMGINLTAASVVIMSASFIISFARYSLTSRIGSIRTSILTTIAKPKTVLIALGRRSTWMSSS
jgi:hypothetical protein